MSELRRFQNARCDDKNEKYQVCSPEEKWPITEVDHLAPSSAKLKKWWSYTSSPIAYPHCTGTENFTLCYVNEIASLIVVQSDFLEQLVQ